LLSARRPDFHLLGDAETRRNWSASNTAFIERDEEAQLRGFERSPVGRQHQRERRLAWHGAARDYRDVVPLTPASLRSR
jgi:hypothetical protein